MSIANPQKKDTIKQTVDIFDKGILKAVVFKVWSLDHEHQHHFGTCHTQTYQIGQIGGTPEFVFLVSSR